MRELLAVLLLGCVGCATTPAEPTVSKTSPAEHARTLSFETGGAELPNDVVWQRSSGLDPMDLRTLGQKEGAARLVELAERGGRTGGVALQALVFAPDARAERARACELLADIRVEERQRVLAAVERLLAEAPPLYEALAPGADATCAAQLDRLAADPNLLPAERDLTESARARLPAEVRAAAGPAPGHPGAESP